MAAIMRTIERDNRDFANCMEKFTASQKEDQKSNYWQQLNVLHDKLQSHRAQIRKMTTSGPKLTTKEKSELGAARARIEQELRRFHAHQKTFKAPVAQDPSPEDEGSSRDVEDHAAANVAVAESNDAQGTSKEVKVLVEQLCAEDEEDKAMAEEFTCQICLVHVVGASPQLTSCSHLFCGDCLEKWFEVHPGSQNWAQRAQSKGSVPCPVCKEPLDKDRDLHPVCEAAGGNGACLWQMLCGTKIMCANHAKCSPEGQCDWIGDYGSYQEHIRACQNVPTRCGLVSTPAEGAASVENIGSCDASQVGVETEPPEHEADTASIISETTVEPISTDASEASECSDTDEAPTSASRDGLGDMSGTTVTSEPAPEESSTLNQLISELVGLKLKEHQEQGEQKTTSLVTNKPTDDSTDVIAVTKLKLDEVTLPSKEQSTSKKSKKATKNKDIGHSNAAQRQAAQMANWQAAQMVQWRQLQAAQVAQWQAAQMHAAQMQAARVQQWRMAQAAWAAQRVQAPEFA